MIHRVNHSYSPSGSFVISQKLLDSRFHPDEPSWDSLVNERSSRSSGSRGAKETKRDPK